jgi:aspartate racemase
VIGQTETNTTSPLLGVLGGMGPAATADFFSKLTKMTLANRDQDHVAAVICSFPQIPDRSDAILNNGATPLPAMLHALSVLEGCGVTRIAIPCSTAHFWFDDLKRHTPLPIIHMVDAVACTLRDKGIGGGSVAVLGTTATIRARVYAERLEKWGFDCVAPGDAEQARIMDAIRAVKAGHLRNRQCAEAVRQVAVNLLKGGAQSVILGCTELPLLLPAVAMPDLIDATAALARACLLGTRLDFPEL